MTRRHYEMIAQVLNVHLNRAHKFDSTQAVEALVFDIAALFQNDNERFDKAKFLDVVLAVQSSDKKLVAS